jgi:uncharacterized protein
MSTEQNKQIAAEFLRAIEAQDVDAITGLLTEDAIYWIPGQSHFPIAGKRGKAETREFFSMSKQILRPGFQFTVASVTAEGDRVSVEAKGDGVSSSGKHYNNTYHFLFRMRDAKIFYVAEYIDTLHVAEVFGEFLSPAPGTASRG